MSLEPSLQLLFALSDLKLVTSVTNAINADLPKSGPLGTIPEGVQANGSLEHNNAVLTADTRYTHRDTFTPSPAYTARPVVHPQPIYDQPQHVRPALEAERSPVDTTYSVPRSRSPIQPPWRVLPWQQPTEVRIEVKVVSIWPDIVNKGSLIDLFI